MLVVLYLNRTCERLSYMRILDDLRMRFAAPDPPKKCQLQQAPVQTKTQGQWPANHDPTDLGQPAHGGGCGFSSPKPASPPNPQAAKTPKPPSPQASKPSNPSNPQAHTCPQAPKPASQHRHCCLRIYMRIYAHRRWREPPTHGLNSGGAVTRREQCTRQPNTPTVKRERSYNLSTKAQKTRRTENGISKSM